MFGSQIDFFGVYFKRHKILSDPDRQKRIADARASLAETEKNIELKKLFVPKHALVEKIFNRRVSRGSGFEDPTDHLKEEKSEPFDPLLEAAQVMINTDRLDGIVRMLPGLNGKQRREIEKMIEYHENHNPTDDSFAHATIEENPDEATKTQAS